MKRLLSLLLAASISVALIPFSVPDATIEAQAKTYYDYYPMACSAFEVDVLNSSGSFDSKGCFNDLESAKNTMYQYGDGAVVRHGEAYSANKVIMMVSGVVYSYPWRNGTNTAYIYQYYENITNRKTTYVTAHREMAYNGTYTYDGNGDGWIGVTLNGFTGYISLTNVDLIPMKAVSEDIPMYLGGNYNYAGTEEPFLIHVRQAYYQVERNGNYTDLVYHCFSGWPSNGAYPQEWTFAIGPAADWMTAGAVYFSNDGYQFYSDRGFSQAVGTYYSYYQFMPLRTRSHINADVYDQYLSSLGIASTSKLYNTGNLFINAQETYGVNALAVFAMACLESAYGNSNYAQQRNNLFGWNAFDSDPDQASTFNSIEQAINEHMGINLRGYLDINDVRFFGGQLGNKGSGLNVKYAADPYWGMKIASIAYAIDKYSCGNNGSLTDYNSASLAVITDDARVDIKASVDGSTLYNSAYGATYQSNHIVTVLAESGSWYEIQSTSYLSGGSVLNISGNGLLTYDWDHFTGWLPKSVLTRINSTALAVTKKGREPTGDAVQSLDSVSWTDSGLLHLTGKQYRPGIYADADNQVTQTLHVYGADFSEVLTQTAVTTLSGNDELSWSADVDISKLEKGIYTFAITTGYSAASPYDLSYTLPSIASLPDDHQTSAGLVCHMGDLNGKLEMNISVVNCGANASFDTGTGGCVCAAGYQNWTSGSGCTAVPSADTVTMMQGVLSTSYDPASTTYTITGLAFLVGMNASADSAIKQTLVLVDMTTGEEKEIAAETSDLSEPVDLMDGYDYTKVQYTAKLNVTGLAAGSYYLKIRVQNGDQTKEKLVITTDATMDVPDVVIGGNTVRLFAHPASNFRMELFIGVTGVDRSVISKPTRRPSVYGESAISINDAGILTIDGYAFMSNVYINAENHPVYSLLAENETTGTVTRFAVVNKACEVDLAALRNTKYTISQSCFDLSADLSTLPAGTYRLYMDIATDQARDIFEIYSYARNDLPSKTVGKRTYTITRSKVHSQYVLTISEQS